MSAPSVQSSSTRPKLHEERIAGGRRITRPVHCLDGECVVGKARAVHKVFAHARRYGEWTQHAVDIDLILYGELRIYIIDRLGPTEGNFSAAIVAQQAHV